MKGFLLDTNVLSEFSRRGEPDPRVKHWLTSTDDRDLFTSVLALAEIRHGIELCDPGKRRSELEAWLEQDLRRSFANRLLPITRAIADRWAVLSARVQRRGRRLPSIDGLMAATAFEHGLTMKTRNIRDFAGLGVEVFNPWEKMIVQGRIPRRVVYMADPPVGRASALSVPRHSRRGFSGSVCGSALRRIKKIFSKR